MSISNNYAPIKSLGNGSTVDFSGNWNVLAASYMRVYLEDVTTGVQTLKTLTTHYTLDFDDTGFTVTFLVAPTSANYVVLAREVDIDQSDPYKTSKGFQGQTLENSLDKLTAIAQDHQDQLDRTPKFQIGSTFADVVIGDLEDGELLKYTLATNKIESSGASADEVLDAADDAIAAAVAAASSETAAAASAGAASSSASSASSSAGAAATSASAASTSATNAASSASSASTSASNASTSASAASTSASSASTSATTATTQATSAAASASAAAVFAVANLKWLFDNSVTMADPGTGDLRLNNATIASATAIAISNTNSDAADMSTYLATFDDSTHSNRGYLTIRKNATNFAIFKITAANTDNSGWKQLTVTYLSGAGTFANTDPLYIGFALSGDDGLGGVSDAVYGVGWDGDTTNAPSKNAVYDKIQALVTLTDGDKGDITLSSSGTVFTIDNSAVTLAKIANAAASSKLLGSGASGSGAAYVELTLGTGLLMSGTTLNVSVVDVQSFTGSGTWNKPTIGTYALVLMGASGGSGGKGSANTGGSGGGGGACSFALIPLSALSSTESVTIGAAGVSQTVANTAGNVGGNTTFDNLSAFGGGGGGAGGGNGGGGGGGQISAGNAGGGAAAVTFALLSTTSAGYGGNPNPGWMGYETGTTKPGSSYAGGGGGGDNNAASTAYSNGGSSFFGGAGGGGGADTTNTPGIGGPSIFGGGGGGGGAGDSSPGAQAGGTSQYGGAGGAGGHDSNNGTAGSQATYIGGGGGGGGCEIGNSGAGGLGKVVVIVI